RVRPPALVRGGRMFPWLGPDGGVHVPGAPGGPGGVTRRPPHPRGTGPRFGGRPQAPGPRTVDPSLAGCSLTPRGTAPRGAAPHRTIVRSMPFRSGRRHAAHSASAAAKAMKRFDAHGTPWLTASSFTYGVVPPNTAVASEYAKPIFAVRLEVGNVSAMTLASRPAPADRRNSAIEVDANSVHGRSSMKPMSGNAVRMVPAVKT